MTLDLNQRKLSFISNGRADYPPTLKLPAAASSSRGTDDTKKHEKHKKQNEEPLIFYPWYSPSLSPLSLSHLIYYVCYTYIGRMYMKDCWRWCLTANNSSSRPKKQQPLNSLSSLPSHLSLLSLARACMQFINDCLKLREGREWPQQQKEEEEAV